MKIVFWNVNGKDKRKAIYKESLAMEIGLLLKNSLADILILAECQGLIDDYLDLEKIDSSYINPDLNSDVKFNIRILHKNNIEVTECRCLTINDIKIKSQKIGKATGNNLKVGVFFGIKNAGSEEDPVIIIASHWLFKGVLGHENNHKKSSINLKEISEEEISKGRQVILIGDYNKSTSEILSSTSLDVSMNKFYVHQDLLRFYDLSQYLYAQHSLQSSGDKANGYGTFVSSSTRTIENACTVIDHIYVSSSFIQNGRWLVDERLTKAIFNEGIENLMYNTSNGLDHLPICLEINHGNQ